MLNPSRAGAAALVLMVAMACTDRLVDPGTERRASAAEAIPADGEYFRVANSPGVYLSFGGARYAVPNLETLYACTGSFPGVVRTVPVMPPLAQGAALPDVNVYGWIGGEFPVTGDASPAVYAVVGCVKSPVPDLATLTALYGEGPQVAAVAQALIDALPTGPLARAPLRAPGTLIQGPGTAEVRWVSFMGGALAVESGEALDSYCRFGADRLPEQVDAAEWAAYSVTGVLGVAGSNCMVDQPPIVRDGEFYRIGDGAEIFMAQQGRAFSIPDLATLDACTGGYRSVVRTLPRPPALRGGGVLPSVLEHPFMAGEMAVRSEGHPAVFAVIGCVRGAVPDPETFFAVFGPSGANRTVVVPDALLASVPRFGTVRLPLRLPGTLIRKAAGAEIRWVTYLGGSLAVENLGVLASHCRSSVIVVSDEEFGAYPARGRVEPAPVAVCGNPVAPALQPDFRMPVAGGYAWRVVTATGEGSNVGARRFALDLQPVTEGLPGQPAIEHPRVAVLASSAATVSHTGWDNELGWWILLTHESGFNTIYGHLQEGSFAVLPGETVERGQVLGQVGSSGATTEPRLHFELRRFEQGGGSTHEPVLEQVVLEGRRLTSFSSGRFFLSSNAPVLVPPVVEVTLEITSPTHQDRFITNDTVTATVQAVLRPGTPQDSIRWSLSDGTVVGRGREPLITGLPPGSYALHVDAPGVSASVDIRVFPNISALYLTVPSQSEIERIQRDFTLRYVDGPGTDEQWASIGYEFDLRSTRPTRMAVIAKLDAERRRKFSQPLPFTKGKSLYEWLRTTAPVLELRLDCGNNFGGAGRTSLTRQFSIWGGESPCKVPFANYTASYYPYFILVHEARHSEPGDPGHAQHCPHGVPYACDAFFENGSGYAVTALYLMWIHKFSLSDTPEIIQSMKAQATGQFNQIIPPYEHSDPTVRALLSEVVRMVTLSPASATLAPGTTRQLTAHVTDGQGNPLTRTVQWFSQNTAVATVTSSGLVTATGAGTTTIMAVALENGMAVSTWGRTSIVVAH